MIYSKKYPEGIEILQEKRTDTNRWIDYIECTGILSDGSQYIIKGNCDYQGSPYGKPSAMTA